MKNRILNLIIVLFTLIALMGAARAATITVTNSASSGPGTLDAAITALNDGDTIAFNIPGAGPHYITPPVGGLPIITKNNITIDGYSQPGSSPNTNPILASNNARIKIVIRGTDTRTGPDATTVTNGSVAGFIDLTAAGVTGFTDSEGALLAVIGDTTGFTVRGICFEGDWAALPTGDDNPPGPAESQYAIALGGNGTATDTRIEGCWFGLDPDGVTVHRFKDGIAWFGLGVNNLTIGVAKNAANAAAARGQFNIFMGLYIAAIGDLGPVRISGNFFNVYPDGLHDYTVNSDDGTLDHSMEAFFEQNSQATSILIGTDGDGANDAEERNVFGGVTEAGDRRFLEWYSSTPSDYRIAGNYFGMGVDGLTRFTNGGPNMQLAETFRRPAPIQFGSDFDGVSDAIEANVISWNYPFNTLYPNPSDLTSLQSRWRFANIDTGDFAGGSPVLSVRGNKMIGMDPLPFTYVGRPADAAGRLTAYSNYVAEFMVPTGDFNTFVPTLSASSTRTNLIGTCAPGNPPYDTAVIIDVYLADPEGWGNGMKFGFTNLVVGGVTNGFPQGSQYLGSFVDNGPLDSNPAAGSFNFNISALGLPAYAFVTATANYSDTVPGPAGGATGAKVHTSNFANPVVLPPSTTGTVFVNSAASSGPGTLDAAITALNDGDTIAFNIPGAGPHYITPPIGGLPIITKNNITIDGYSQPGSSPNTNPILAANNARIKIVIRGTDTRTGPDATTVTNGSVAGFIDLTAAGVTGFTDSEGALLAVIGDTTGFTVRGICFEGDWAALPTGDDNPPGPAESQYAIALGGNGTATDARIEGCWFGLDPDGVTVHRFKDGIAWFGLGVNNLTIGVAKNAANAAAARGQFNIFMGLYIAAIGDLGPVRISGNFFNVYPDGLHDYTVNTDDGTLDHSMEAFFEQNSQATSILIGTDGDGANDAEERNVFGGVTEAGDRRFLEWYSSTPSDYRIAGNYFGMGVDGLTRFTNGGPNMQLAETFRRPAPIQFGSDFDGVSDAIEANVISWNYPFNTLYPNPSDLTSLQSRWRFANIDTGDFAGGSPVLSVRGNKMIGMDPLPFTYVGRPADAAGRLTAYSNYVAEFMVPTGDFNTFVPTLSASSTRTNLIGTCAPGNPPYDTAVIIDVYLADPEGWGNGMKFGFTNLVVGGVTNGFPQGSQYLGSFVDNGPLDSNPAAGSFNFNISALGLPASAFVTATANYSDTVPGPAGGATGAKVHTSNFANPIGVGSIKINSIVNNGDGTLTISWTGGQSVYSLIRAPSLTPPVSWTTIASGLTGTSTVTPVSGSQNFYRITSP